MSYEVLSHTADLRLRVRGKTLRELFTEALRGLQAVTRREVGEGRNRMTTRRVALTAPNQTVLLVDFLNEALSLSHIHREVYTNALIEKLADTELAATLTGAPVDCFDEDIKAVTYHEADVKQNAKGEWETMLVFDI